MLQELERIHFHQESCHFVNKLTLQNNDKELPITNLLYKNKDSENKLHFKEKGNNNSHNSKDHSSICSSVAELQWENDIFNDEFINEQNGNELEWDHYEEETISFHNETEQIINEIEEMTKNTIHQMK